MSTCPYCGVEVADVHGEVEHMNAAHPDIVAARLRDAGLEDPQARWVDPALTPPIPKHLRPLDGPLGLGDLQIVLRTEELERLGRAIALVQDARTVRILHRDGSPWVEMDVITAPPDAEPFPPADVSRYGHESFALWRYTLAVYRVGLDGAVEEDPIDGLEAVDFWRHLLADRRAEHHPEPPTDTPI